MILVSCLQLVALNEGNYLTPEQCGVFSSAVLRIALICRMCWINDIDFIHQLQIVASAYEVAVAVAKFFCGPYVDGHKDPGRLLAHTLLLVSLFSPRFSL